jgi:hypothetical protein
MKLIAHDHHCSRAGGGISMPPTRHAPHMPRRRAGLSRRALPLGSDMDQCPALLPVKPRVLLIDADNATALVIELLLTPEVELTHVSTLAAARAALAETSYSLAVIDPVLCDGDASELLPSLRASQLLVYSATEPEWRVPRRDFLSKQASTPRKLYIAISGMLGLVGGIGAGD